MSKDKDNVEKGEINLKRIFQVSIIQLILLAVFVAYYIFSSSFNHIKGDSNKASLTPSLSVTASPTPAIDIPIISFPPSPSSFKTILPSPTPVVIKPASKKAVEVDLDGDSKMDKVELFLTYDEDKYDYFFEYGSKNYTYDCPFVQASVNGNLSKVNINNIITRDSKLLPFKLENGKAAVLVTTTENEYLLSELYAIVYNNNSLELLPVPLKKNATEASDYNPGYDIYIKLMDDYKIDIACEQTGFNKFLSISKNDRNLKEGGIYDDNGKVISPFYGVASNVTVASIVAEGEKTYVKLRQEIWSYILNGYFESFITWDNDFKIKVISQKIIPID